MAPFLTPKLEDLDDPTVEAVTNLAGHALPPGIVPTTLRMKSLEDALDWLRKNQVGDSGVDDPDTLKALCELAGMELPEGPGFDPSSDFLDWLRGGNVNPDDIDVNLYYGDFLKKTGKYKEAEAMYLKALNAPAREGRDLADEGRRKETIERLEKIRIEISKSPAPPQT